MGTKKKHQDEPQLENSSESFDEDENTVECPHVNKAIDFTKVKRNVQRVGFLDDCDECKKMPTTVLDNDDHFEYDLSLWLCLRCGNQACGRTRNQHALIHYQTPHSDCHSLCINTTLWHVWCYECDNVVNTTCKKRLLEVVDYLRKQYDCYKTRNSYDKKPSVNDNNDDTPQIMNDPFALVPVRPTAATTHDDGALPRPRGLANLGNTCFFNSVMQCLGQTPYLLDLLEATSQPGQYFGVPGGRLDVSDDKDTAVELEPLEGILDKWRPLTANLAETLAQIRNGRSEVYAPRLLLQGLTNRMPQFAGGHQHDAHELLRHLLEAVREDDLRRYQCIILDKLGLNRKTDPSTVQGRMKKIVKFYGQQASEMLLPTEQVFRGTLVSTLQCQECQHTSHRDEFFLDLSLPISERQLPPILRRKADEIEDNSRPSKHQIKKEKRAERKRNKKSTKILSQQQRRPVLLNSDGIGNGNEPSEKSESESDADIEDNVEDSGGGDGGIIVKSSNPTDDHSSTGTKGGESGYGSDKIETSSPDSNALPERMRIDDSGAPSPAVGMLSVSPDGTSPTSSETNVDMGSPLCGRNSPTDDFDRPESRLAFVNGKSNNDLKMDLEKLSLLTDGDGSVGGGVQKLYEDDKMMEDDCFEGACGGEVARKRDVERMEEDNDDDDLDEDDDDDDLWTDTMSARYQCEDGEFSVQSCLNQFTARELMTGNNKVGCESCTKRAAKDTNTTNTDSDKRKSSSMVYTNTTKQLLIYIPPAVLILHLKRFQVFRFRSTKVCKYVKFPILLDLAPFCSKRSQNLPTFDVGQTKVLYSLYGVVEHSGSMHGGHYVAFVKVRPTLDANSYRWQFLPKNQKNDKGDGPKGAQGEPKVPDGRWYYISDSHVSEVSESKVLQAQAYLLFYERIM